MADAYFAMGCFWKPETVFRHVSGVTDVTVGYSGGTKEQPTYRQVCAGGTGHAEAVYVQFDPERVTYARLLTVFWNNHHYGFGERTAAQATDQYRSAIFTVGGQAEEAEASRAERESGRSRQIVTVIEPLQQFWPAEEYHQRYMEKAGRA